MKKTASLIFIRIAGFVRTLQLGYCRRVRETGKTQRRGGVRYSHDTENLENRYKMVLTPYLCNGADTASAAAGGNLR